jgi:hypothetical protein
MLRSLHNKVKVSQVIAPINSASTTDINSTAVEVSHFGSLMFVASFGISGDTLSGSVKVEAELEHSDDNSNWSDCADSDLSAAVAGTNTGTFAVVDGAADDEQSYSVGYLGSKQYVRVVMNKTGTHTVGIPLSAYALQGHSEVEPV